LDGLRAISVLAVFGYHAHLGWMVGGYLGVEIFFAISGYLITSLLLKEHASRGRIAVGQFLLRRGRRLLPALFALLFFTALYGWLGLGAESSQFRHDLVSSLLYHQNWHQIWSGSSYFSDSGLPLLRHLWSLAVEEQFYLVWPLLVWSCLRLRKGRLWPLFAVTLVLAAASCLQAFRLADPYNLSARVAGQSLNRVYLGTDTRALGLLLGVLLAIALSRCGKQPLRAAWHHVLNVVSLLAFAGLIFLAVTLEIQEPWLYQGGFILVDVCTLIVVAGLAYPTSNWMGRLLGWGPLEWIGQRSYGLYLWHWPIFRLMLSGQEGWMVMGLRILATFVAAEVSYRWLETPIRQQGFLIWLRRTQDTPSWRPWTVRLACLLVVLLTVKASVVLAGRPAYVNPIDTSVTEGAAAVETLVPESTLAVGPSASEPVAAVPDADPAPDAASPAVKTAAAGHPAPRRPGEAKTPGITAIGDSVMKGAAAALKSQVEATYGKGYVLVDAEESRSFAQAIPVVRAYKKMGRLGEVVVLHLGANNSSIPDRQFKEMMSLLADRRGVIFVTAKTDKTAYCEKVNETLANLAKPYHQARIADWKGTADPHPEYFYSDRTHLRVTGAQVYASFILGHVAEIAAAATAKPAAVP
jgi:peptidoglycan/LPS O-acetylase OafA/YrhL